MADSVPAGALCLRDCGCVAIAEWFDGDSEAEVQKRWRAFRTKAKRRNYRIKTFDSKPEGDWLCVPHRAAHEAYKAAKAQIERPHA